MPRNKSFLCWFGIHRWKYWIEGGGWHKECSKCYAYKWIGRD